MPLRRNDALAYSAALTEMSDNGLGRDRLAVGSRAGPGWFSPRHVDVPGLRDPSVASRDARGVSVQVWPDQAPGRFRMTPSIVLIR